MKKILFVVLLLFAIFFLLREQNNGPNVSQNGISTYALTSDIFAKYDKNLDEQLSVSEESFLREKNNGVILVESRGLLLTDADKLGDQNGYVSELELETFISQFDCDGDGELTSYTNIFNSLFKDKSEWSKFEKLYGEKFKYE